MSAAEESDIAEVADAIFNYLSEHTSVVDIEILYFHNSLCSPWFCVRE
jgi:hypothetical protein